MLLDYILPSVSGDCKQWQAPKVANFAPMTIMSLPVVDAVAMTPARMLSAIKSHTLTQTQLGSDSFLAVNIFMSI